ncbi:MAG: formamidopyrimidine-DNA glycosylase [Fimbriimonadaceae bacterium]|jgi:formamidopyrimidine-DNA glycosylase|nr:formamidopyrimidine-DNA glycosylase [Fimbriimonadaceae bacterium]
MPELPEVETVCRVMRRALVGKKIVDVEVVPDTIMFGSAPRAAIESALQGKTVKAIGRKGKAWWIETDSPPVLFGHLGMTGWIRQLGKPTTRLREHGEAPLDDEAGRPRFLKLMITAEDGSRVALTDGRRLGRVWLSESPEGDPKIAKLGPDAMDQLPKGDKFAALFRKRNAPIKTVLMDQHVLSGIGNWLADEVLYQSRIAPQRLASSLSDSELAAMRRKIVKVLKTAVDASADSDKYPKSWLFHHRWGGSRGAEKIGRHQIVRDEVGGRTTAWVPALQK